VIYLVAVQASVEGRSDKPAYLLGAQHLGLGGDGDRVGQAGPYSDVNTTGTLKLGEWTAIKSRPPLRRSVGALPI